jgi:adenylate cyclase
MPVEIERKFLLASDQWRSEVVRRSSMRQGYLGAPGGKASIRVRLEERRARLNIKSSVVGDTRDEYEYEIPLAEATEMYDNLCVGRIEKVRHYIERDGLTWEIDEFGGDNQGLVVAEVELSHQDQNVPFPPWLGREITTDARYYNHSLALKPYRAWHAH